MDRQRTSVTFFDKRKGRLLASLGLLVSLCGIAGCPSAPPSLGPAPQTGAAANGPELTADEWLDRLIAQYGKAEHYWDRGKMRLSYYQDGALRTDDASFSVAYHKPGKLAITAYQIRLACDGQQLTAVVEDDATGNLDGQCARRTLKDPLTLAWLYEDRLLQDLLGRGLGGPPVPLELLLGKEPLQAFRADSAQRTLLDDAEIGRNRCARLQIETENGRFVLWIDRETFLLRRLEYPVEPLAQQLVGASKIRLRAEFTDCSFAAPPEDRFKLEPPEGAKQVRHFVAPPQPLASQLFGKKPAPFHFTRLGSTDTPGRKITQADLEGRITVLLWFSNHPASRASLQLAERVRSRLADSKSLRFLAVCTDPRGIGDASIRDTLKQWQVAMPAARDLQAAGRDIFKINLLPSLVVLNARGEVQVFDEGLNEQLESDLPRVLQMLIRGENVAASVLQQAQNDRLVYERALVASGADEASIRTETPIRRAFPKATRPFEMERKPLWRQTQLKAPGNLLVVSNPQGPSRLLVHEGWRSLAELDLKGNVKRQFELDLPAGATVSYLRTAAGKKGRRYCAADILGKQAHVFDEQFRRLFSYPSADQKHEGLRDCLLADLDADGKVELAVGYWALLGAQGVDMTGKRQWGNRVCSSVQSITLSTPNPLGWRRLLLTGDTGAVHLINQFGKHDPPRSLGKFVDQLFTATFPTNEAVYCAISQGKNRGRVATGLDAKFQPVWNYDLPGGVYGNRLQYVTSGLLGLRDEPRKFWVFAGPDGSVHLIRDDGDENDFFYVGQEIRGLACGRVDGQPALLIATRESVSAWALVGSKR